METADAMELSAAEGLMSLDGNSNTNATETAMRQLSLEAGGASLNKDTSPQRTDDGLSQGNSDEEGEDEKGSVTGFIEAVVSKAQNAAAPKTREEQSAVFPSILAALDPVDAEVAHTQYANMDEDAATPKVTTKTLDSNPPSTDTPSDQVAMDEDTPVTGTSVPSNSGPSEENTSEPKTTAPAAIGWGLSEGSTTTVLAMAEDAPATETSTLSRNGPLEKKPSSPKATTPAASGWGPPEESTSKAGEGWGVSTTTASSNGWGPPASDTSKENPFGATNTTNENTNWGSNGSTGNSGNWGSGGSGRGFDHGGRGGYRDRDSPRKGARPSSFNAGFGPQEGERQFGHGRFASGSNTELLRPLGRGRASPMKGGPRKVGYEPYPVGGRREVRSMDDSGHSLDYTDDGRFEDTVVQVETPMAMVPVGQANRLTPMSPSDLASFKTAVMRHLKNLQKQQEERYGTIRSLDKSSNNYQYESHRQDEKIKAEEDLQTKFKLIDQRAELRSKALHDERILLASLKLTDTATQGEIEGILNTIGEFLVNRTTACIQDLLRTISSGNGAGQPCDVEAVVERCLTAVAPRLLKDQMSAQEGAQRRLEQKQAELEEALKAKDATIHEMAERLKRIEDKLECQSGFAMANVGADQSKTNSSWWFRK